MDQPVVIGPTRDAVEPSFEQSKLAITKIVDHLFEEKYGKDLFLEHPSPK